jgi:hypothetical protein
MNILTKQCQTVYQTDTTFIAQGLALLAKYSDSKFNNESMSDTYAKDFVNFCQGNNSMNVTSMQVLQDFLMFLNDEYKVYNNSCYMAERIFQGFPS